MEAEITYVLTAEEILTQLNVVATEFECKAPCSCTESEASTSMVEVNLRLLRQPELVGLPLVNPDRIVQ